MEILRQVGWLGLFVLSQVAAIGPEADDAEAVLGHIYPEVPVAKGRLGHHKAFMQAPILGQAITEFDRERSKAVREISFLFQEICERLADPRLPDFREPRSMSRPRGAETPKPQQILEVTDFEIADQAPWRSPASILHASNS